jgi:pimeloyl-ACP methyl ester carboxylesterase
MTILLVHGLGRTPFSFRSLVRRLRRWGYRTETFGYAALAQRYDVIVARLVARLEVLAASGQYAVIGHSLGGLMLRSAIARLSGPPPRHLIMLGTPNRPPRLAHRARMYWIYRRLTGESGVNLASPAFYAALPVPTVPYTIVAGDGGPLGRWSPFGDEPNDGIVALRETRIRDDDPLVVLPVTHTFMMNKAQVQAAVRRPLAAEAAP